MINKSIILKFSIISCLILFSCAKNTKSTNGQKTNNLKDYELERFLTKTKTKTLYNLIDYLDNYLKDSYSNIPSSKERMFKFSNDLLKYYNNDTDFQTSQKTLNNISFFCPLINDLKKSKLLDDILTKGVDKIENSEELNSWINSILIKEGFEIPKKLSTKKRYNEIDSLGVVKSVGDNNSRYIFNCKSIYYYSIYKSSKPSDKIIREYIEQIILYDCITFTPDIYLQRIIKSVPKEDFDNPLLKVVIFTDFYLPLILIEDNCE